MLIGYYTFKEIQTLIKAKSNQEVHNWLFGKDIDIWSTSNGRGRIKAYCSNDVNKYLNIGIKGNTKVMVNKNDINPLIFNISDKVSYWEGNYKWDGEITDILKNDTYEVSNTKIGKTWKRWFEISGLYPFKKQYE